MQLLACTHLINGFGPNTLLSAKCAADLEDALYSLRGFAYVVARLGVGLAVPAEREYLHPGTTDPQVGS